MKLMALLRLLWPQPARREPVLTTQPPSTFDLTALVPLQDDVPAHVAALTVALQRRTHQRNQLRSLITVESALRFAPQRGLSALGEGTLIRALQSLSTFEELQTDEHLLRLQRRLYRSLAEKQVARMRAEGEPSHYDVAALETLEVVPNRCGQETSGTRQVSVAHGDHRGA